MRAAWTKQERARARREATVLLTEDQKQFVRELSEAVRLHILRNRKAGVPLGRLLSQRDPSRD